MGYRTVYLQSPNGARAMSPLGAFKCDAVKVGSTVAFGDNNLIGGLEGFASFDFDGESWSRSSNVNSSGGTGTFMTSSSADRVYSGGGGSTTGAAGFDYSDPNWASDFSNTLGADSVRKGACRLGPLYLAAVVGKSTGAGLGAFTQSGFTKIGNLTASFIDTSVVCAMTNRRIALAKSTATTLEAYDFNGIDWTKIGNTYTLPNSTNMALAGLTSTRIIFLDRDDGEIVVYSFDGTNWSEDSRSAAVFDTTEDDVFFDIATMDADTVAIAIYSTSRDAATLGAYNIVSGGRIGSEYSTGGGSAPLVAELEYFLADTELMVTDISPFFGVDTGGDAVTITGFGFTGSTTVTFGGNSATSVTAVTSSTLTCNTPAGTGTVDVVVTDSGKTWTVEDAFIYFSLPP